MASWKEFELRFARYLRDELWAYDITFAPDRCFRDWDIKATMNWVEVTYEIKSDRKSEYTWNTCIEYKYKWQPSWVDWTKADYFIIYSDKKRRMQQTDELRKRLENTKKRSVMGGNGDLTTSWLIRCSLMPTLFEQLDIEEMKKHKVIPLSK